MEIHATHSTTNEVKLQANMNILSLPLNLNKNQTFGVLKRWDEHTLYSRQPPQKGDMCSYLYLYVLKRWLLIWATCMFGGVRAQS